MKESTDYLIELINNLLKEIVDLKIELQQLENEKSILKEMNQDCKDIITDLKKKK